MSSVGGASKEKVACLRATVMLNWWPPFTCWWYFAAKNTIRRLSSKGTSLTPAQLGAYQDPWQCFCRAASQLGGPQPVGVPGVAAPRVQDSALLLVECHEIFVSPPHHLSSLSGSFWMVHDSALSALPPSFVSRPFSTSEFMVWLFHHQTILVALLRVRFLKRANSWRPIYSCMVATEDGKRDVTCWVTLWFLACSSKRLACRITGCQWHSRRWEKVQGSGLNQINRRRNGKKCHGDLSP